MHARIVRGSLIALAGLLTTGCHFSLVSADRGHHRRVTYVHVPATHVCSYGCENHCWDGDRVVVLSDHHHGPGCGHRWDGAHWVLAARVGVTHVHAPRVHVCAHDCHDHYWNGVTLVALTGHHHGPGCGHHWNGKYWVLAKSRARTSRVHGGERKARARRGSGGSRKARVSRVPKKVGKAKAPNSNHEGKKNSKSRIKKKRKKNRP